MRKILSLILFISMFCMFSCKNKDKHTVDVPLPYEFADDTLIKYIKLFQEEYKDKIDKLVNKPFYYKHDKEYPPRPYIKIIYNHNDGNFSLDDDTDIFMIWYSTDFYYSDNTDYGILIYVDNVPCIISRTALLERRTALSPLLTYDYLKNIQSTYKYGFGEGIMEIHGFSMEWELTYKNGEFVSLEINNNY